MTGVTVLSKQGKFVCVFWDVQLKDTALPPSPIPLSVVPLELTAWMVNRLFLLLRHAFLLACCSLDGRLGEHAASCLSSSSSVVSQGGCGCSAGGSELVSVVLLESSQGLTSAVSVALVLQTGSVWFWGLLLVSVSPWSNKGCVWFISGRGSAAAAASDWLFDDASPQQGSVWEGPAFSPSSCSSSEKTTTNQCLA